MTLAENSENTTNPGVPAESEVRRADKSYQPRVIERKWQEKWDADKLYRAAIDESRPKHYALIRLEAVDLHFVRDIAEDGDGAEDGEKKRSADRGKKECNGYKKYVLQQIGINSKKQVCPYYGAGRRIHRGRIHDNTRCDTSQKGGNDKEEKSDPSEFTQEICAPFHGKTEDAVGVSALHLPPQGNTTEKNG